MDSNLEQLANRLNSLSYVPQKFQDTDGNDSDLDLTALVDIKLTETPKPHLKQRSQSMFKLDLGKLNQKQKKEDRYRKRRENSLGKLDAIAKLISPTNLKNGQKKQFHKRTRSLNYLRQHKEQVDMNDDKSQQQGKYISLQQKVARGVLAPLKMNENSRSLQKKTSLPSVLTKPNIKLGENRASLQHKISPTNKRSPILKKQIHSGMTENGTFELKRKNPKRLYMKIR